MTTNDTNELSFHTTANVALDLLGCEGEEAMSTLFECRALLACKQALSVDRIDELMTRPCALVLGAGPHELVCGIVSELTQVDTGSGEPRYVARIVPSISPLGYGRSSRVFVGQESQIDEMVPEILEEYGMKRGEHFEAHLFTKYEPRGYLVQYEESALSLVTRWFEHYGIGYWFEHTASGDVLHYADSEKVAESSRHVVKLPVVSRSNLEVGKPALWDLDRARRRGPARTVLRDATERAPSLTPTFYADANHRLGFGTVHEVGGPRAMTSAEGEMIARRRAERHRIEHESYRASTNHAAVRAGCRLELTGRGAPSSLLVVESRFRVGYPVSAASVRESTQRAQRFQAEIVAIDDMGVGEDGKPLRGDYRPPRTTPWPRIHGVVHGAVHVDGDGDLAYPDPQGRYRVRLAFVSEDPAVSLPLRVTQLLSGSRERTHFPLRRGTPVALAHAHGDPDQPTIVAVLANDLALDEGRPPVNQVRSLIRTASGIELQLDDANESPDPS